MINVNRSAIGTGGFLKGVNGTNARQRLPQIAATIGDEGKTVVGAMDTVTTRQVAKDLGKLQYVLNSHGLTEGQSKAALMAAGALVTGPSGAVVSDLVQNLHQAVSSRKGAETLAEQAVAHTRLGGLAGTQMETLGLKAEHAARRGEDGVSSINAPVALFMGGAVASGQEFGLL